MKRTAEEKKAFIDKMIRQMEWEASQPDYLIDQMLWSDVTIFELHDDGTVNVFETNLNDASQRAEFDSRYHFDSISIFDITVRKGVRTFWNEDAQMEATVLVSPSIQNLVAEIEHMVH